MESNRYSALNFILKIFAQDTYLTKYSKLHDNTKEKPTALCKPVVATAAVGVILGAGIGYLSSHNWRPTVLGGLLGSGLSAAYTGIIRLTRFKSPRYSASLGMIGMLGMGSGLLSADLGRHNILGNAKAILT